MNPIRQKAIQYLTRREYSRLQLQNKLLDDGFEKDVIESVLTVLLNEGLQSDLRFAENIVRNRKQVGYGPERISYELEHCGIDKSIIHSVVDPYANDWVLQMARALAHRFPNSSGQFLQKKARFLENRGYTAEDISRALNREKVCDDG